MLVTSKLALLTIAFFLYKVSFCHLQKCFLSHFKDNIHNVSNFDSHVGYATGTDLRLIFFSACSDYHGGFAPEVTVESYISQNALE